MNKKLVWTILGIFLISLVSAVVYNEPWIENQDGNNHNLTGMDWITANHFNGSLSGGSIVIEDLNVTGNLISNLNATDYNITMDYSFLNSIGAIGSLIRMWANLNMMGYDIYNATNVNATTINADYLGKNINASDYNISNVNYINPEGNEVSVGGNLTFTENDTGLCYGDNCAGRIYWNGSSLIIEVN